MIAATKIEAAVVAYQTAKLAADASLSGITYAVRSVTGQEKGDRHEVVARAADIERPFPNLCEAIMETVVQTPADKPEITVADHGTVEQAIFTAWDKATHPTAAADLSTLIAVELPGWHGADFFVEGWQPGRQETNWLPVFRVKVGVAKDGV